jgi:hypothetical protein
MPLGTQKVNTFYRPESESFLQSSLHYLLLEITHFMKHDHQIAIKVCQLVAKV